jgi:YcxB-like protein
MVAAFNPACSLTYNPAMVLHLNYRISEADFIEAQKAVCNARTSRKVLRLVALIDAIGIITIVVFAGFFRDIGLLTNTWQAVLIGALLVLWVFIGPTITGKRMYRRDQRLKGEFSADFTDEGVAIETGSSEGTVKWSGFTQFRETRNLMILHHTDYLFNIFPKRFFTEEQLDFVRNLVKSKLPAVQKYKDTRT